jgi:hypothetical protein
MPLGDSRLQADRWEAQNAALRDVGRSSEDGLEVVCLGMQPLLEKAVR